MKILNLPVLFLFFLPCFLCVQSCNNTNSEQASKNELFQTLSGEKQRGTLIYTFAVLAYTVDAPWGKGVLEKACNVWQLLLTSTEFL